MFSCLWLPLFCSLPRLVTVVASVAASAVWSDDDDSFGGGIAMGGFVGGAAFNLLVVGGVAMAVMKGRTR